MDNLPKGDEQYSLINKTTDLPRFTGTIFEVIAYTCEFFGTNNMLQLISSKKQFTINKTIYSLENNE